MTTDLYDVIHRGRDVHGQFTGTPIPPGVLERVLAASQVPDLERHGWRRRRPLGAAVHTDRWGARSC